MSFDWSKYIHLAKELNTEPFPEEKLRSAVSRSYYGIFNKARIKLGLTGNKPDIHKFVIDKLKESGNSEEYTIGNNLSTLRKERNDADYDGNKVFNTHSVSTCIERTEQTLQLLDKID